jgi:hypothetical protein
MRATITRLSMLLALAAVLLAGTPVLAQDGEPVRTLSGAVNIIAPDIYMMETGAAEEIRIIAPTGIEPGEILRTDEFGVALVTWFFDGTETVLDAGSELALNEFSGTSSHDYVLDMELSRGHLVAGLGDVGDLAVSRSMVLHTPAYTVRVLRGQFEIDLNYNGEPLLVVTKGQVEVAVGDEEPVTVDENHYLLGAPGEPVALSDDGVTPNLNGVCKVTADTNLNVRQAASEESRRLGGVNAGRVMWVRAATEGRLWLQVYFQTNPDDVTAHNFGWIYGPAGTLDEAACEEILRAPLDAQLYGGPGIGFGAGEAGEAEPPETEAEESAQ